MHMEVMIGGTSLAFTGLSLGWSRQEEPSSKLFYMAFHSGHRKRWTPLFMRYVSIYAKYEHI